MNTKVLIDSLVRQTTILIGQLSTAAGIRAPLAHIADQVFLELSREIEAQGVSRKVVADMFGLALRTYQKKVQRVTESVSARDKTLWQLVLERLQEQGSLPRRQVLAHFHREDPFALGSVLNDLVSSGLVSKTGSGDSAVLGVARDLDIEQARREQGLESLGPIICVMIYRAGSVTRAQLFDQLAVDAASLDSTLAILVADGQVTRKGEGESAVYSASTVLVPLDAETGWEAAVLDHFQTMVQAIGCKIRRGQVRSSASDVVGGATLSFDVSREHPSRERVFGLLQRVRADANELWNEVQAYNNAHPILDEDKIEVSFYFGQSVSASDED